MVTLTKNNVVYYTFDNLGQLLLNILILATNNSFDYLIDLQNKIVSIDGTRYDIKEI